MAKTNSVKKEFKKKQKHLIRKKNCVCYLCGQLILKINELSIDHVTPISKGGSDEISNLKATHKKCNSDKNDKLLDEYLQTTQYKPNNVNDNKKCHAKYNGTNKRYPKNNKIITQHQRGR